MGCNVAPKLALAAELPRCQQSDDIVTHDSFLSQEYVTDPSSLTDTVTIDGAVSDVGAIRAGTGIRRVERLRGDAPNFVDSRHRPNVGHARISSSLRQLAE
jgi:hypothetical protein